MNTWRFACDVCSTSTPGRLDGDVNKSHSENAIPYQETSTMLLRDLILTLFF